MVQKKKYTSFSLYKVTVLRTAKTLRDEFVEIEGQGWVNKSFVTEKIIEWKKVQDLLNSKYNSPSYGIYGKTIRDWKYCWNQSAKKCILPV